MNGRFSSEDIARDGLNWYTYCGNNPIRFIDPSGNRRITDEEAASVNYDPRAIDALSQFEFQWQGEHVDPSFLIKVVAICNELGIKPDDLMTVMATESGLNPSAKNGSVAAGLIQFTNTSLKQIKQTFGFDMSLDKLSQMSAYDQLDYVQMHLSVNQGKMNNALDVYTATFAPYSKAIGKSDNSTVIYWGGSQEYSWNSGLDNDKDGNLSKYDLQLQIDKLVGSYRK